MRDLITLALNRSGVAAIVMNEDGTFVFVANLPDCWTIPASAAPNLATVFGEEVGGRLSDYFLNVLDPGIPATFQCAGPDEQFFEFGLDRVFANGDRFLLLTVIELTEERRREQRLRALLRELSHRSKNLLAIILSVASQTAKNTSGLSEFLQKFRGRVYSISHSQDLVTDANWRGAHFRDLIRSQADKYDDRPDDTLLVDGADPMLSPNEALHIGLAIHELFVDAMTIGEVADALPSVSVTCTEKPYNGRPGVEIVWRQTDPPGITEDDLVTGRIDGFHSTVLNRIAPAAVGGEGSYENRSEGPLYKIHFPRSSSA